MAGDLFHLCYGCYVELKAPGPIPFCESCFREFEQLPFETRLVRITEIRKLGLMQEGLDFLERIVRDSQRGSDFPFRLN